MSLKEAKQDGAISQAWPMADFSYKNVLDKAHRRAQYYVIGSELTCVKLHKPMTVQRVTELNTFVRLQET